MKKLNWLILLVYAIAVVLGVLWFGWKILVVLFFWTWASNMEQTRERLKNEGKLS